MFPRPILQKPPTQTITHVPFLRQFPNDLLMNESDSSRLTDIVDVKLYNPVTKRLINAGTLESPVNFLIPLKSGRTLPNESYVEVGLTGTLSQTNSQVIPEYSLSLLLIKLKYGLINQSELLKTLGKCAGNQITYPTKRTSF